MDEAVDIRSRHTSSTIIEGATVSQIFGSNPADTVKYFNRSPVLDDNISELPTNKMVLDSTN